MPFYKLLRKYMFPVPMTKTIRNVLEILAGDWKYTGTLNSSFATLSSGLEFANKNIMYILVTQLCMYKKNFPEFPTSCRGLWRIWKSKFRYRV